MFPEVGFVSAKYDILMSLRVSGMAYFRVHFFGRSYKKYKSGYSLQGHTSGANFAVEQERRDSNKTQCILRTMSKRCTVFHNDLTFLLTISLTTFCGTNRHRILTSIEFRTANISTVQTGIIAAVYFA